MDPGEGGRELAAGRETLERGQLGQPLGPQRGRDPGVEGAEIERLAPQPFDDVVLGQAVLRLVGQRHRDDDLALGRQLRQHLGLESPNEAVAAQVPVEALLGEGAVELAAEARPGAELRQPPDHPQLRDQLVGVVEHRGAGEGQPKPVGGDRLRQAAHRLGSLGARVLAQVRLVGHQRSRPAAGAAPARSAPTSS